MRAMRFVMALGVAAVLAGCDGGLPDSGPNSPKASGTGGLVNSLMLGAQDKSGPGKTKLPLARVRLAGGDVVVVGPDGYCLDPVTVENSAARGFALIASCHILSDGKFGASVEPILVTVTVGPKSNVEDIPTPKQLSFAANAPLIGGETRDGFVVASLGSGGDAVLDGGDTRYWRGAFLQGDRMVGLALYAPKGSAYAGSQGGGFLRKVHGKIVSQSPGGADPAPKLVKKPGEENLLGRLFNR